MAAKLTSFNTFLLSLVVSGLLGACSGDQGKPAKTVSMPGAEIQRYSKMTSLSGAVNGKDGPLKSGMVKAMTPQGATITETMLHDGNRYKIDIPAGTALPLLLHFQPQGSGEAMNSAVVHASISKYDINPTSTEIAKRAKALGGYTHANLVRAAETMVHVPDANKTTSGFRGDPTTQYGGWH